MWASQICESAYLKQREQMARTRLFLFSLSLDECEKWAETSGGCKNGASVKAAKNCSSSNGLLRLAPKATQSRAKMCSFAAEIITITSKGDVLCLLLFYPSCCCCKWDAFCSIFHSSPVYMLVRVKYRGRGTLSEWWMMAQEAVKHS